MKYYVTVAGRQIEVDRDGDRLTIDGRAVDARIDRIADSDVHVVRVGDQTHRIEARRSSGRGRYDLSLDGFRLPVEALDERARAIRELSRSAERSAGPTRLTAPMPGLIVRVNVKEGDAVRAGQGLIVIEAMKMENELKAASGGVVRRVGVTAGSAVEKGALLLELEASNEA